MSISTRCACCRRSSAACLTTASSSLTAETSSAPLLTCSGTLGVIGVGSPEGARDWGDRRRPPDAVPGRRRTPTAASGRSVTLRAVARETSAGGQAMVTGSAMDDRPQEARLESRQSPPCFPLSGADGRSLDAAGG